MRQRSATGPFFCASFRRLRPLDLPRRKRRRQQRRSLRHLATWASSGQIDSTRVSVHRCFRARNPPPGHRKRPGPPQARVCIGALGQGRLAPEGADYALPAVHVSQPAISRIGCANSRMAKAIVADRKMAPTSRVSRGFGSENSWEARGDHVCSCRLMRAGFAGDDCGIGLKSAPALGKRARRMSRRGHRSGVQFPQVPHAVANRYKNELSTALGSIGHSASVACKPNLSHHRGATPAGHQAVWIGHDVNASSRPSAGVTCKYEAVLVKDSYCSSGHQSVVGCVQM